MLIERSYCFDTTWAMVNLVKSELEKINIMPKAMPPIKDKGNPKVTKNPPRKSGKPREFKEATSPETTYPR